MDLVVEDELSLRDHGIPGTVLHTPGHSPGSLSVVLDTGEAFVGDLAMNGPPLTRKPDLFLLDGFHHRLGLGYTMDIHKLSQNKFNGILVN